MTDHIQGTAAGAYTEGQAAVRAGIKCENPRPGKVFDSL